MKRIYLFLSLFLLLCISASSQIHLKGYNEHLVNPQFFEGRWPAQWIGVPEANLRDFGVYHFRKTFDLTSRPEKFVVHVSADNRYKLYVNDSLVSLGPCRGDLSNWNFETVDIARFLKAGRNVLAAVVWNFAQYRPAAQISKGEMAFLLQGNSDAEKIVNTNNSWKCVQNKAYSRCVKGRVRGYYAAGPTEQIDVSFYPERWTLADFDDTSWHNAIALEGAAIKGTSDYPGRLLVPDNLPPMEMAFERFQRVRRAEGIKSVGNFAKSPTNLVIPSNTSVKILLDQGKETTGYLTLLLGGGKGATVDVGYAETLFTRDDKGNEAPLGNRNDIEGKVFFGYQDCILPDGRSDFNFTPWWWRTWRYVELAIQTKDQPLTLKDVYGTFCAYPFKRASTFEAKGDDDLQRMLDVGWHTARLCANETYMDCPYYEQLQYFGDTRIQTMVTMYNTTDTFMVKSAVEQGRRAMLPDGLTYSRYPTDIPQIISSYALSWTGMVYDYWMYRGDASYVRTLLPAVRQIMSWYEQWMRPDGSLSFVPYWFFCDWSAGFNGGTPIREKDGKSAYQDLAYLMALDEASRLERAIGIAAMGDHYAALAERIRARFKEKYWDNSRGLFADTYDHRNYSQHVNIMAILTDIVTGEEATSLCSKILEDNSLTQATIYFRYYLFLAMKRAGLADRYLGELGIWRQQLKEGMTTWAEMPEPTRSDCHAWGASPNIELFRIFLGIDTDAPGFNRVRIAPALGKLREAQGSIPHPKGTIRVKYKLSKNGTMKAVINLPDKIGGSFVWNGKEYSLHGGEQVLEVR